MLKTQTATSSCSVGRGSFLHTFSDCRQQCARLQPACFCHPGWGRRSDEADLLSCMPSKMQGSQQGEIYELERHFSG